MPIFVTILPQFSVTEGSLQEFYKVVGLKFLEFPTGTTVVENLVSQRRRIFSKKFLKNFRGSIINLFWYNVSII